MREKRAAPAVGLDTTLTVNQERLGASIRDLARVGQYVDGTSGLIGVNRLALSDADGEGRRLVCEWMEDAGLEVLVDAVGNVFAIRSGLDQDAAPVMMGSHLDSVPTGGAFDGALGVLGGLEVIRTLNEERQLTRRPLVVAIFTEEEGVRFGTDMLGSAVATGRIPLRTAYDLEDPAGETVHGALERIGFLGTERIGLMRPHAYVECHVEQGPILGNLGADIGVVTGVQGISWQELTITGTAAHAGTTPIGSRRDAGLLAARINIRMREMALSGDYGDLRATMGVIRPYPGGVNVIPGQAVVSIDLRNPDDAEMKRSMDDLREYCEDCAVREGLDLRWRQTARTNAVPFDPSMQQLVEDSARARGLIVHRMIAGAGHDAQEWARLTKAGMIFIPGEFDGISHNPRERSTPEQCANGVNTLLTTVLALAR